MTTIIPFDTLEFFKTLRNSGMNEKHAEAITIATACALSQFYENFLLDLIERKNKIG